MGVFNINLIVKKFSLLVFLTVAFSIHESEAQRFKGSALFGLNLSQIEGDELAGYTKLGFTGGFKLAYPLKDNVDINLEMLYSQRGSSDGFSFGSSGKNFVDLQYVEIPIYVNIKDWFIEDKDYHKVKAHAGLSYGYLFGVESTNGVLDNNIDNYKRHSVSYLLGIDYSFNSRLGFTLRYTRGFNSLYVIRAISYFLTLRTEYSF